MAADPRNGEGREFRLEGLGLLIVGGVLLAAVFGAFFLGGWVERRSGPQGSAAEGGDPLAGVVQREPPADADSNLTFFDRAEGAGQQLEPTREARPAEKLEAVERPPAVEPASVAVSPPSGGDFFVQVFAGRDRGSAESVVDKLKTDGWAVRLFTDREGQGSLFKVRVGGYATQDEARSIASNLQKAGYSGAWVTRIE